MRYIKKMICALCVCLALCSCVSGDLLSLLKSGGVENFGFTETVPFDYSRGLIIVEVKINQGNKSHRFIVDTGAGSCVISSRIFQEYHLPTAAKGRISSGRKKESVAYTIIETLRLGGVVFSELPAAVMDLNRSPVFACMGVDGIIGNRCLHLVPYWKIDYRNRRLTASDSPRVLPQGINTKKLPFMLKDGYYPMVKAVFSSSLQRGFMVDLGFSNTSGMDMGIDIREWPDFKNIYKKIHFIKGGGYIRTDAFGRVNGDIICAEVPGVLLGELTLAHALISFQENYPVPNIGNGFFERYLVGFDWNNKLLCLSPYAGEKSETFPAGYGLTFMYDEKGSSLRIGLIYDGSPAHKAGLRVGDRIVEINGRNTAAIDLSLYCGLASAGFFLNEDSLELKVLRDAVITFRLEKACFLE